MTNVLPIIRSDAKLSRILMIIVYAFKIVGLAPFSFQYKNNPSRNSNNSSSDSVFLFSKIGLTYNMLLSLLILVLCILALPEQSSVHYPNKSSITQAIDITQDILRTSTICIIIVFGALRQGKAISIMNRILQVDCLLSDMKRHPFGERTPFIFLIVQMILDAVLWITFWASEGVYVKTFLHWFIFNVPIFVMHWFIMEYSIVLGLTAREFQSLNKNLSNFEEFPNDLSLIPVLNNHSLPASSSQTRCGQLAALESLHKIRTTLSEVSQDIADFFSLPTLPVVACFSLTLVYNIYYLITPIVIVSVDVPLSTNVNAVAWILACVYPLILLSINVIKTLNEAKLTGSVIHKLLAKVRGQEIQTKLERFSLQLVHENITFTAYGFFPLDFTLIQSIFGVTATYLVIVIQFMQSAANAAKNTSCSEL